MHQPESPLTPIEQEAVVLAATLDLIDDMVNLEIFESPRRDRPTNLWFKSGSHKRIFAILLGDFLSQPNERARAVPFGLSRGGHDTPGSQRTYLKYLLEVGQSPQLGADAVLLVSASRAFANWLDAELTCKEVWLSGLEIQFDMRIARILMLQIVADMSKHNFSRLEGRIRQLQKLLADYGYAVEMGALYLELPVFEEWLYTHLFSYHASTIAEFLNAIRTAIYSYLRPEFERAYRPHIREGVLEGYSFDVPAGLERGVGRGMYWRLMNAMRFPPIFGPFAVSASLKDRF